MPVLRQYSSSIAPFSSLLAFRYFSRNVSIYWLRDPLSIWGARLRLVMRAPYCALDVFSISENRAGLDVILGRSMRSIGQYKRGTEVSDTFRSETTRNVALTLAQHIEGNLVRIGFALAGILFGSVGIFSESIWLKLLGLVGV